MSTIPMPNEYATTSGNDRRVLRERLVNWWLDRLKDASSFGDVFSRASALKDELNDHGYSVDMFDEDAESMVIHSGAITPSHTLTVTSYWDEDAGSSVSFLFSGLDGKVQLARSSTGGVVELPIAP